MSIDGIVTQIEYKIAKVPLKSPYRLSYGTFNDYEIIQTELSIDGGIKLIGEVTPLSGYTEETLESIIKTIENLKGRIINKTVMQVISTLDGLITSENSFAISTLLPPLEIFQEKIDGPVNISRSLLLYALEYIHKDTEKLDVEIAGIYEAGYKTIKIKLGKNFRQEMKLLNQLKECNLHNLRIRFDANGGYNTKQTSEVLTYLSENLSEHTDYLEQPLNKTDWLNIKKLCKIGFITPIMLDESFYNFDDIKRANDAGVRYIKIKLCKFGSLKKLKEVVDYAADNGMNIILGNGVATDIANYYEICFYNKNQSKIYGAIESVGFLKLVNPLKFNIGVIQ